MKLIVNEYNALGIPIMLILNLFWANNLNKFVNVEPGSGVNEMLNGSIFIFHSNMNVVTRLVIFALQNIFISLLPYYDMKAVVLGGAGVMGSNVVKYLSKSNVFSEIIIGDINEEMGKKIKEENEKVDFKKVDVNNKEQISHTLRDADVVVNCVGPFYRFAPNILKASIEQNVEYVDICDDYDITKFLIEEFNEKALNEDITCIIGLGASPGLTNVIASYASKQLTRVKEIKIYVTRGIKEEAGGAIPYHMLHCWLGEVPVYKNGEYIKARGLIDGEEFVNFPEPFGQTAVYYFGHPETVTLPLYIEGIENVCCKGSFFPKEFRDILLQLQSLGLVSNDRVKVGRNEITPLDFLASYVGTLVKKMSESKHEIPSGGAVMVEVSGEKNGETKIYRFAGISTMREGTTAPPALGAEMIVKGEIKSPGVKAPEACVPPKKFMNELLKKGIFGDTWITTTEKIKELP
ncbi:MAG TPA: NAD-dependent epimerase/dehydratase family protein [Thermoplasmatales archaeon]|nr:NAD-dependent epimerase/dehydratase family protein [Thermoplasmatales archaeon]